MNLKQYTARVEHQIEAGMILSPETRIQVREICESMWEVCGDEFTAENVLRELRRINGRHLLQGKGTCNQALFEHSGDTCRVRAILGLVSYIDRDMPVQEARDLYRKLRDEDGWSTREVHMWMGDVAFNAHVYH